MHDVLYYFLLTWGSKFCCGFDLTCTLFFCEVNLRCMQLKAGKPLTRYIIIQEKTGRNVSVDRLPDLRGKHVRF